MNGDGKVDLKSEMTFGPAYYAAGFDASVYDKGNRTSYLHTIAKAFLDGRKLLAAAKGEKLTDAQRATLMGHAKTISDNWEKVLAEATFKYAGSVYKDMVKLKTIVDARGDPAKAFRAYAKHWGELKGFSLALQAGKNNLGEAATRINRMIGAGPLLLNASQVVDIDSKGNYVRDQGPDWGEYMLHMAKVQKLLIETFGVRARNNDVTGEIAALARLPSATRPRPRTTDPPRPSMDSFAVEYVDRLADQLLNPQKRVFLGYLLSALALALAFQWIAAGRGVGRALPVLFSPRIWWSRSARADYRIAVLNQAVMMGVAPRLVSKLAVATLLFEAMHVWFDGRALILAGAPGWAVAAGFTVALFLLDDATRYLLHRWLHTWPVLWCFHRVHHTAETLTPFTVYRSHPVEGVLFALRSTLVQAGAIAAFVFFLGDRVELLTVLGANAIVFAFKRRGVEPPPQPRPHLLRADPRARADLAPPSTRSTTRSRRATRTAISAPCSPSGTGSAAASASPNAAPTSASASPAPAPRATASPLSISPPSGTPPRSCTNLCFGGSLP